MTRVQTAQHAGRNHILDGHKNCQDALRLYQREDFIAGVVTDGSSNGNLPDTHSEVGAQLAAEFMIGAIENWSKCDWLTPSAIALKLDKELQRYLQALVTPLYWHDDAQRAQYVKSHLQFTVLGFIWTPKETCFFYVGDGTLWINDEIYHLNEGNEPSYPAYRLVPYAIKDYVEPTMTIITRRDPIARIAIGSDAWKGEKHRTADIWGFYHLQRSINVMSNISHSFKDDVSIIKAEDLPCEDTSQESLSP